MAFNYRKLSARIVEKYGTQLSFAQAMGLSERTMSLKLNNQVSWKNIEINKAIKLLDLDPIDIPSYFFAELVH